MASRGASIISIVKDAQLFIGQTDDVLASLKRGTEVVFGQNWIASGAKAAAEVAMVIAGGRPAE